MGLPEDAVAIVRTIYDGAATSIVTPHGLTKLVYILTGTGGDPLSPFLWNRFMDPLLRWLEVGGRGYKYVRDVR